ncbi:MAG: hypothetical protein J3K34DRAFT_415268 [Monoraphidium minutum]|nr:MAG: hypothetical protein J3K34DRAFT_415268 [Monoraphidium minutum]
MFAEEIDRMLKPILLKDLRIQCRARGLSPAGGKEQLSERLRDHMLATQDFTMRNEGGDEVFGNSGTCGTASADVTDGCARNNYSRPAGQNVGNFLTDRCSSRVLAPPGGGSQIVFGDASSAPASALAVGSDARANNNYSRPSGQNVGNFLTDKNSSRVLAPPGGRSQITFG